MNQIKSASLLKFNSAHAEHLNSYQKIKKFNFNDVNIIKTFLESTDFPEGVIFDYEDLNSFICEGEFMVGIDFEDENLDDWKYLFSAFNVYFSNNQTEYTLDENLSKVWRSMMKSHFADSAYNLILKLRLEEERKAEISKINEKYDNQLKDL